MAQNDVDRAAIRQYLLGTLTPDLQQKLEERLLTEPEFLEQLEIEEDELIDEYLADDVPREDREKLERHFLATPERQQHLRFAVSLRRYVVPSITPYAAISGEQASRFGTNRSSVLRAALVFGLVLIVAGAFWLYGSRDSSVPTFAAISLEFTLDNNRAQGVEAKKVNLRPNLSEVRLSLRVPEGAEGVVRYRASLDNLDNERAKPRSLEQIQKDAQSLLLVIPAAQLVRGRYALKLFAIRSDGTEERMPGAAYFDVE